MAKNETTAEVGLDIVGGDLNKSLEFIERKVQAITRMVSEAGSAAVKAGGTVNVEFDKSMKMMQATLGQLKTIQAQIQTASRAGVTNAVSEQAFAKKTLAATVYAKTLKNATSVAEAFQARMNNLEKTNAAIGNRNELMSRKQEAATLKARQNLEELKRIDAEIVKLDKRARRTDGNFTSERKGVTSARSNLEAAALNPKRSNFDAELAALNRALDGYSTKLVTIRSEQAKTAREEMANHRNRIKAMNEEQSTYRAMMSEEQAAVKRAAAEEAARHAIRIQNIRTEGRMMAAALTTPASVDSAKLKNGSAITGLRAEIASGVPLERQRQIYAEINALQAVGGNLQQRSVALAAQGAREGRTSLQYQRELNSAQVRGMTTLEQVANARKAAEDKITAALQIGVNATHAQQRASLELLATERARLKLLDQRQKQIVEANRDPVTSNGPNLFGSAGIGGVLARTAGYAAAGAAIYGVVNAVREGEVALIEFEEGIHKLGAISGSTKTQMDELSDTIISVARHSKFSASEITEAATELAQAGYSARGIQTALKSANDLAIGSGSSISQSVDVITASMGAFQLQEEDSTMVSNGLTAALNKSRLALPQVALGIQYAGVTAKEQNISFAETTAAFAAMAQAGIRSGSTMGTGLRQLLTDLAAPTSKLSETLQRLGLSFADVDVSTLGIEQVLRNLSDAGFSASEAYGSMEKRGAAAYLALRSQLPVMEQVKVAMSNQTAAAEAAAVAGDTLSAAWQRAKSRMFDGWEEAAAPFNKWLAKLLNAGEQSEEMINLLKKQKEEFKALDGDAGPSGVVRDEGKEQRWAELVAKSRMEMEELTAVEAAGAEVTQRFAAAKEESATAAAKASEAFNSAASSLTTFEESMRSAIMRSGSLKDGSEALKAETISLMNRYPELARNVDTAKNSYISLIDAMRAARGDMIQTNAALARSSSDKAFGNEQTLKENKNALAGSIQLMAPFKKLNKDERDIYMRYLGNTSKAENVAALSYVSRPREGDDEAMRAFRKEVGKLQAITEKENDQRRIGFEMQNTANALMAAQTPALQALSNEVSLLSSPGTTNAKVDATIKKLEAAKKGASVPTQTAIAALISTAQSSRNQTGSFAEPKGSQSNANAESGREITLAESKKIAKDAGFSVTSALRPTWIKDEVAGGPQSQERLYNTVRTPTNPVAKPGTGKHESGNALDVAFGSGVSPASLRSAYKAKGVKLTKVLKEDGHYHIEWGTKSADRAQREEFAADMSNDKMALRNATEKLDDSMGDLTKMTSSEVFGAGVATAEKSFKEWEEKLRALTKSETMQPGFGVNNAKVRLDEVEKTIAQKRKELSGKIGDGIVADLKMQFKAIDEAMARSMQPYAQAVASAEGALEGLDRYGVSKNVPDYVRTLAAKRRNEAVEAERQVAMPAAKAQLEAKLAKRVDAEGRLELYSVSNQVNTPDYLKTKDEIASLSTEIDTLTRAYANMQAQAAAPNQIVTDLSGNIRQAIEAWQELHISSKSYGQLIGEEISPLIDSMQSSFTGFFSEAMSGTTSLGAAFGNLAKSIVSAIQQIVAKLIATKVIEMLVGLAFSIFGGSSNSGITSTPSTDLSSAGSLVGGFGGSYNGGPVHGRANGGLVETGFPGRDSSLYNLAKGEYVMRGAAVKSVGKNFMRDLNNHGAKALQGVNSMPVMPAPAKQEMAVYVVAPSEKPSLGPNDVIMTMNQELLKDGSTRKLVRHISQGG